MEPLKNHFGPQVVHTLAQRIQQVHPAFLVDKFCHDALQGFDALELMPRAAHTAQALRSWLPQDIPQALHILQSTLGPVLEQTEGNGMAPFQYLPHSVFVSRWGLDHFDLAMDFLHALTQRFTSEFAIRPFLEHHTARTLTCLQNWINDSSPHVRRLVSEGTRPRLPWGERLRQFQKDPTPCLALLEQLKDDPHPYVRRSVANHLGDIGKDHPQILLEVASRWIANASPERTKLLQHALRMPLKAGNPDALALFGFAPTAKFAIASAWNGIPTVFVGDTMTLECTLAISTSSVTPVRLDFCVHYVKANGSTSPKSFRLPDAEVTGDTQLHLRKEISLREMTTRKHHPGLHRVELLANGTRLPVGTFTLKLP